MVQCSRDTLIGYRLRVRVRVRVTNVSLREAKIVYRKEIITTEVFTPLLHCENTNGRGGRGTVFKAYCLTCIQEANVSIQEVKEMFTL